MRFAPFAYSLLLASCVLTGACDKNGRHTRSPEDPVAFGTQPSQVGDREKGEYTVALDLSYKLRDVGDQLLHTNLGLSAEFDTEVTAIADGLPSIANVSYRRSREYRVDASGVDDTETWVAGRSYTVEWAGGTSAYGTAEGKSPRREEIAALDRDFARFGSSGSLQAQLRGKTLDVGDTLSVTPGEVMDRFPRSTAEMMQLRLVGFERGCGDRQTAVFDATVAVTTEFWEGVAISSLSGKAEIDVATARPIHIELSGPAKVMRDYGRAPNGEGKATFEATFARAATCR